MFCGECGREISDDSSFCPACGKRVESAQPNGAPVQSSATPTAPTATPVESNVFTSTVGFSGPGAAQASEFTPQAAAGAMLSQQNKKLVALGVGVVAIIVVVLTLVLNNLPASSNDLIIERISDPVFRSYMSEVADTDEDGVISAEEAQEVESLDIAGATTVCDLTTFPNLKTVTLQGDSLTSADLKDCKELTSFVATDCSNLTDCDLSSNPKLETIDVTGSPITSLDLAGDTNLKEIECDDSVQLFNLDSTPLHEYWVVESFHSDPSITPSDVTYDIQATYDDEGLLTKLVSTNAKYGSATLSFGYDNAKALSKVVITAGSYSETRSLSYNETGLLKQITWDSLPADAAMGPYYERNVITYNNSGLPINSKYEVNQGGASQKELAYGSKNDLVSVTDIDEGGREVCNVSSDDAGRITEVTEPVSGSSPKKCNITYDAAGNIQEFSYSSGLFSYTQTMQYDAQGRVVNATRDSVFSAGEIPKNHYGSVSSADFEYNENGLLTKMTPTRSGSGTVEGYSISYKRILTTSDKASTSTSNFIDLSNPLSPRINVDFWRLDRYLDADVLAWQTSMQDIMAKLPSAGGER